MKTMFVLLSVLLHFQSFGSVNLQVGSMYKAFGVYQQSKTLHSTLFIGERKAVNSSDFIKRLNHHIELVADLMKNRGLVSYTAYATVDYEAAVMQWESESAMKEAFSQVGSQISSDATQFLESKIWTKMITMPKELSDEFFKKNIKQVSESTNKKIN